jgi:hypothetical protein
LALLKRGQCDPLKENGRDGTALAGTLNSKQASIGGASLGLQLGQMPQPTFAAEVIGRVETSYQRNDRAGARPMVAYARARLTIGR